MPNGTSFKRYSRQPDERRPFSGSLLPLGAWLLWLEFRSPLAQRLIITVTILWVMVVIALVLVCPLLGAIRASGGRYDRYPIFGIPMPRVS